MLANILRRTLIGGYHQRTARAAARGHCASTLRRGVHHTSHASAQASTANDPFSSWIAANPLPGGDQEAQPVSQQDVTAADTSRITSRRYHHTAASAIVRKLSQSYGSVQWLPDRTAFLFTARLAARLPSEAGPDVSDVLLPVGQPLVSLRLPIVLQRSNSLDEADAEALLERVAAGKAESGRMLIALLTADSAALALWEVRTGSEAADMLRLRLPVFPLASAGGRMHAQCETCARRAGRRAAPA